MKNSNMHVYKARPGRPTRAEYKALFQELNESYNGLCRVEDALLDGEDRRSAHTAAGQAVMWAYILRSVMLQRFDSHYPFISREEYNDITGKELPALN